MTRIGKIARLPRALRHELNHRLADGEPGLRLVAWLNCQPVVQNVLAAEFQGRPISPQNLSEWKTGGYQDWLVQQETLALTQELADNATELSEAAGGQLADHLAGLLAARYARLLAGWNGEPDAAFNRQAQALRALGRDVAALRRGDQAMERLRLEQEKYAGTLKARGLLALEAVLEEVKGLPEVADAFDAAFALFRKHQPETPFLPEAAPPVRPHPSESGWSAYSGTEPPEPEVAVTSASDAEPVPKGESENFCTPQPELRNGLIQPNPTESNQSVPEPDAAASECARPRAQQRETEGDAALPPAGPSSEASSHADVAVHALKESGQSSSFALPELGEIQANQTRSNQSEAH